MGYREVRLAGRALRECPLAELDDGEIEAFVGKWTAPVEKAASGADRAGPAPAAQERGGAPAGGRGNPGVRSLAANPLLLTILALMKRGGVALPERRVELYKNYVETLLALAPGPQPGGPVGPGGGPGRDHEGPGAARPLDARSLARRRLGQGGGAARKLESSAPAAGTRTRPAPPKRSWKTCGRRFAPARAAASREYGFIHLTFQEFLAAAALACEAGRGPPP